MNSNPNVLFVSHDATRTGAPIVLLHLLRWLRSNTKINITLLLKQGGEMEGEFESLAKTYYWRRFPDCQALLGQVIGELANKCFRYYNRTKVLKSLSAQHFDLVYLNTVGANDLAPSLKNGLGCPILNHVHENEYSISYYCPRSLDAPVQAAIDGYIAVSESTRSNLVENHGIPAGRIDVVNEFIPTEKIRRPAFAAKKTKAELGIADDQFVVGGSGVTGWRKGTDLFMGLALMFQKLYPQCRIKFVWVGSKTHEFEMMFEYERKRLGLDDNLIFTGSKPDPENYFQVFDVFALTSREDPFPLVCIEAAALGKPILCFDQAGGIPKMAAEGAGFVVPYGDMEAMAKKILELKENAALLKVLGASASAAAQNYDVNCIAPQLWGVMQRAMGK